MSKRSAGLLLGLVVALVAGLLAFASIWEPSNGGAQPGNPITVPAATTPPTVETTTIPIRPKTRVSVIGDSYTAGTDMGGSRDAGWATLAIRPLTNESRIVNQTVNAIGGTGYVKGYEDKPPFGRRVQDALTEDTSVVVVFGSRNDGNRPIEDAARSMFAEIRASAPGATLIVVAPPWVNENPPDNIVAMRDTLKAVSEEFGAVFVDTLADEWFYNEDSRLIGEDGVHPTNEGHVYMADRLRPVIEANLPF
jgi:lysophospholipase L1-like esterase